MSSKNPKRQQEYLEYSKEIGIVTKDSTLDNIVGTTGEQARRGYAIMGTCSSDRDAITMMDGTRMNTSLDVGSARALTNSDEMTSKKVGIYKKQESILKMLDVQQL